MGYDLENKEDSMKMYRWMPVISGMVTGVAIWACQIPLWRWQFWLILAAGFLSYCAGICREKWNGNREAVQEALKQLKAELETPNPRILCLMVKAGTSSCSKEIQHPLWNLKSVELRRWNDDEEVVTLTRTIDKS